MKITVVLFVMPYILAENYKVLQKSATCTLRILWRLYPSRRYLYIRLRDVVFPKTVIPLV